MGPNGPPNAKEAAYIAPEIANYRKPGHWGYFWSFWPAISEPGWTRRQKVPLRVLLKAT